MDAAGQTSTAGDDWSRTGCGARARRGSGEMISPHPKVIRFVLLIIMPFLLALVGGAIWLQGGRTASTEDAYVKTDIGQVAAEVSGRVLQVLVRDHTAVDAGMPLVKLDPEPFKLVLQKAEAELDNARTTVET